MRACFRQAGVSLTDVRWLFLTGGSSAVSQIGDAFERFFTEAGNSECKIILAPLADAPLSVARGAAVRYAYTIEGALPCSLSLEIAVPGVPPRTYLMLPAGDMPGARRQQRLPLQLGPAVRVRVLADFGGEGGEGSVYEGVVDLTGNDTLPHDLRFTMTYGKADDSAPGGITPLMHDVRLRTTATIRRSETVLDDDVTVLVL